MKNKESCKIAIIGLSCFYPGAKSPVELWENVLARKRQFRQMPDVRLPNSEYYDSDPSAPDKTYQKKAAVIDGYSFDWLGKRIPKKSYESTDIVHWLALDTSLQAVADAGYTKEQLPSEKMGVIIGNTLTGEFTRANYMRQRWPYIRKVLKKSLEQKGLLHHFDDLESTMEKYYKSVFSSMTEDSLAGGLANTIAGRICNFLDLHGGGYIVDGACSSSLLAICTAANALESGQMDMAIAGGVDISLDTFELIGFAKTGALTKDEMRVYDKNGAGFLPGEGCGAVIMKRLEDAEKDGDQIYAILNGWGISSDGKGGITAPSAIGQSRALRRAYDKVDFDTSKLDFIEGHGTGTTVGDKTELEGISLALNKEKTLPARNCGVTSFKSIVGHTKAAAGIGAFIKTVISLNRRILPPTAGLKDPNPIFADTAKSLYPILHGEIRKAEDILYAGVSAMGFGGINSHVLLQSGHAPFSKLKPSIEEKKLLVSNQESEIFFLSANDKDELIAEIERVSLDAAGMSYAELADFAYAINNNADLQKPIRASIVAINPFDLEKKLNVLKSAITAQPPYKGEPIKSLDANSIFFGYKKDDLRIGALYPGQGSQKLNMGNKLVQRFDWASELVEHAKGIFAKENTHGVAESVFKQIDRVKDKAEENEWRNHLKQTDIAQPAIILNSLIWQLYLEQLGLKFAGGTGHSLGELMSFYAAGFYDEKTLLRFAAFRGKSMSNGSTEGKAQVGSMASLICSAEKAKELIKKAPGYSTVANINGPEQTVISGERESIKYIVELAKQEQIMAVELPVSGAFHSDLVNETAETIKHFELLKEHKEKKKDFALISSVSGNEIHDYTDLNTYFADQAIGQVNFVSAINSIKEKCDVLIEIGPGKVLSGLVNNIASDIKCYPVEANSEDDLSFNTMLASLFVLGADIKAKEIYKNRLIREFKPARDKEFIVNPVERPFPAELDILSTSPIDNEYNLPSHNNSQIGISGDFNTRINDEIANTLHLPFFDMQAYLKERGDFLREIILTDLKYLRSSDKQITYSKNINDSDIQTKGTEEKNNGTQNNGNAKHVISQVVKLETKAIANELRMQENSIIKAEINTTPQKLISLENLDRSIDSTNKTISKNEIRTTLYALVAEKTGFPTEGLKPEYRLLDDLNMDSIKAGSMLGELFRKYQLQSKLDAAGYANNSLEQIVEIVAENHALLNTNTTVEEPNQSSAYENTAAQTQANAQTISSTEKLKVETAISIQNTLIETISSATGFPSEGIKSEYRLLDDLNMDSIKAGSVLGQVAKQYGLQGKFETSTFANASIADITENISSLLEDTVSTNSIEHTDNTSTNTPIRNEANATTQTITEINQPVAQEELAVQSYSVELIEESISNNFSLTYLDKNVGIVFSESSEEKAQNISKSLIEQIAPDIYSQRTKLPSIELIDIRDISNKNLKSFDKLLILVPNTPDKGKIEELDFSLLKETVNLLSTIASNTAKFENDLVFIQSGDGYFSRNNISNHILKNYSLNNYSAVSFAASIHFERLENKIRVIEFHDKLNIDEITKLIFSEIEDENDKYIAAAYDSDGARRRMIYGPAEELRVKRNALQLTSNDVILVTGGGKGITAECALALASKHNCKMALVGSSPLSDEVRNILSQYSQKSLSAQYYSCDITNIQEVYILIDQIKSELGNVTGIVHGAAVNKPRLAGSVNGEEAYKEISPKLIGAINLIQALTSRIPPSPLARGNADLSTAPTTHALTNNSSALETNSGSKQEETAEENTNSLKLFVALTSIIGITGMPGNSWYAFSNEALDLILRNLSHTHNVETLSMAYSVWGETGMGAKMGSIKRLAGMGIGAISTEEGVAEFIKWIENKSNDQQIVVAAGLGGLDTWREKPNSEIRANRYLEEIVHLEPGFEIVARAVLSTEHDKYILDHDFNGSLLFPTVFGLEAMTQAAAQLCGLRSLESIRFENVSLLRPIVVPKNGEIKIQIRAQIMPSYNGRSHLTRLKASISTEDSNFTIEHFSADIILNPNLEIETYEIDIPSEPLRLHPETDLYSWLLFQGKMFQNIDKIYTLKNGLAVFSTKFFKTDTSDICFSKEKAKPFILGSSLLRDTLLQSAQLTLTHNIYLPLSIEKWEIFDTQNYREAKYVECRLLRLEGDKAFSEVTVLDKKKRIIKKITGYITKALRPTVGYPSPNTIGDVSLLEEKINDQLESLNDLFEDKFNFVVYKHSHPFNTLNKRARHSIEQKVFAKHIDSSIGEFESEMNYIIWSEDGKPSIENSNKQISISHSGSILIMTIGDNPQGCDIEFVEKRSQEEWIRLIGEKNYQIIPRFQHVDNSLNTSATRLWCVRECVLKAFGSIPSNIEVKHIQDDNVIFDIVVNGLECSIITTSIELSPNNQIVVARITKANNLSDTLSNNKSTAYSLDIIDDNLSLDERSKKFKYNFYTTFKDCKALWGKTYFTNFADWMGKIRELSLNPISKQLIEDLNSGEYGMVTNESSIRIYGEAESLDSILGTVWATPKSNIKDSFIDLQFEWFKVNSDKSLSKIADCNLSSTWVRIESHGIVKKVPMPQYLSNFLNSMPTENKSSCSAIDTQKKPSGSLGSSIAKISLTNKQNSIIRKGKYSTGIINGNSVGNIYYSNYYDWQAKSIEKFIYSLKPEVFTSQGRKGEYVCLESNVNHLQEAMPFEIIEVCMYLEELYEKGFKLYFEYFSVNENARRKLAYGSNTILWAKRKDENSSPIAEELPSELKTFFMNQIPNNTKLLESIS